MISYASIEASSCTSRDCRGSKPRILFTAGLSLLLSSFTSIAHAEPRLVVGGQSNIRYMQVEGSTLYFLTGTGGDPHYISSVPTSGGVPTSLVTISSPAGGDQDTSLFVMDADNFYGWWGGYAPGSLWSAPRSGGSATYYFTSDGAAFLGQDDTRLFFYRGFYSPIRTISKDTSSEGVLGGGCGWPRANAIDPNFIYCQDYWTHNYSRTSLSTGVDTSLGVTGSNEFNILSDSNYLYFLDRNGNNSIEQFDKEGNYVRTLVTGNSTASMSDDTALYFYDTATQSISSVPVEGGLPKPLVNIAWSNLVWYLAVDGVLYYIDSSLGPNDNRIFALPLGEVCGDGAISDNEDCDDGNDADGDGCSSDCVIESGWACTGEPSLCDYYCPGTCESDLAERPKVVAQFVKNLFGAFEECASNGNESCPCPTPKSDDIGEQLDSSCSALLKCQVNRAYSHILKPDWEFSSQCWIGTEGPDCLESALGSARHFAAKNMKLRPGQSQKVARFSTRCVAKLNKTCPGNARAHDVCVAPLRIGRPDGLCASCMDAATGILRASNTVDGFNEAVDSFLRVTAATTLENAPPDIRSAIAALALQAESDASKLRNFLSVGDLYSLLRAVEPSIVSLDEVLVALNESVTAAYQAPAKKESQLVILMVNIAPTLQHPGTLDGTSPLTAFGSIIFPEWFVTEFPATAEAETERHQRGFLYSGICRAGVAAHYVNAMLAMNLRGMPSHFVDAYLLVRGIDPKKLECASTVPLVTLKSCLINTSATALSEWVKARGGDPECDVPDTAYQEIGDSVVESCVIPFIHPEHRLTQCGISAALLISDLKNMLYQDAIDLYRSYGCILQKHSREDAAKCDSCIRNGGCLTQAIQLDSNPFTIFQAWLDPLNYRVKMQCNPSLVELADNGHTCSAGGLSGTCSNGQCLTSGGVCSPGSQQSCMTGSFGICAVGTKTCNAQGTSYGTCFQNQSAQSESCSNGLDDDCDGDTDSNDSECQSCLPGSTRACSTGMFGICSAGLRTCNASGTGYGGCQQSQTAGSEACGNGVDDDCDGSTDENCGAILTTSVYPSGSNAFFPSGAGTTNPACTSGCSYNSGNTVNVTATPAVGSAPDPSFVFSHWEGDANNPNSSTTSVTMNGTRDVTANFLCTETEGNNTSGSATSVPLTKPCYGEIRGRISSSTDVDWFDEGVSLSAGETLSIDLDVPSGVDYDLELYGPSGSCSGQCFLANSDNGSGSNESITYTTQASGYFGFRVYLYSGSTSSTPYVLTYDRN